MKITNRKKRGTGRRVKVRNVHVSGVRSGGNRTRYELDFVDTDDREYGQHLSMTREELEDLYSLLGAVLEKNE